ncbi:MAG: hypothetical protein MJ219_02705 [Mycoplasmoidaceae bacterium]|nr:hypothetical protein [Mycoplasmoidaceae bacterium]
MANEEYKTTVISYDERPQEVKQPRPEDKPNIQNVLFNVTTAVPHVTETLPTMKIEPQPSAKKIDLRPINKINKHASSLPRFYVREYYRST